MVSQKVIKEIKEFAFDESNRYLSPTPFALRISFEKGAEIADKLAARKEIVLLGTLLMDCQLGLAVSEKRIGDHVTMSAEKAKSLLLEKGVDIETINTVVSCILQHHGSLKFDSLESEICCNADCYRFISVKGFLGAFRYVYPSMEFKELVGLLDEKVEEKWKILSLNSCREELKDQYQLIRKILESLK